MKKLITTIAAVMLSTQAFAFDINVGDETVSFDDAVLENISNAVLANGDELTKAFDSIDKSINSDESLNAAFEQAIADQAGDVMAAVSQVTDAATTGAVNGHSAEQVMNSARDGVGVKVEK